jgi:hypothetical protein
MSVDPVVLISLVILAGVLLIAGALARLYIYKDISASNRAIREFNQSMVEKKRVICYFNT